MLPGQGSRKGLLEWCSSGDPSYDSHDADVNLSIAMVYELLHNRNGMDDMGEFSEWSVGRSFHETIPQRLITILKSSPGIKEFIRSDSAQI